MKFKFDPLFLFYQFENFIFFLSRTTRPVSHCVCRLVSRFVGQSVGRFHFSLSVRTANSATDQPPATRLSLYSFTTLYFISKDRQSARVSTRPQRTFFFLHLILVNLEGVEFDFVDVDENDAFEEVFEVILENMLAANEIVVDGHEDRLLANQVEESDLLGHFQNQLGCDGVLIAMPPRNHLKRKSFK